jgi:hypothetical protein
MAPITGSDWLLKLNQSLTGQDQNTVQPLYVDTVNGNDGYGGLSWGESFKTMGAALSAVQTGGKIFFRGDVREQLTGSNTKYDISIIGVGSLHHPDKLASEHPGACMWRMPASGGVETTPLLIVRGRGWKFQNVFFDGPATAAAVQLVRTAEGASEYDASHASFIGCRFTTGQNHIEDNGGVSNITIVGCEFRGATAFSILNVSGAGIAFPLNWKIYDNFFMGDNAAASGNAGHIDAPLSTSIIKNNVFGKVTSTGLYIDLTGGVASNVVCDNILGGVYDTSDYVAVAGDLWYNNRVAVKATTAPDGLSLTVPAAP